MSTLNYNIHAMNCAIREDWQNVAADWIAVHQDGSSAFAASRSVVEMDVINRAPERATDEGLWQAFRETRVNHETIVVASCTQNPFHHEDGEPDRGASAPSVARLSRIEDNL